jgi:hypothetical protein
VGIGTVSPNQGGGTRALTLDAPVAGNYSGFELMTGGSLRAKFIGNSSQTYLGTSTATPLILVTSDTERMRIDSAGRMTLPYQPSFAVYSSTTISAGSNSIYNTVDFNVGSHYNTSNGRFTAPVTGKYFITTYCAAENVDTWGGCDIRINGTAYKSMYARRYLSSGSEWCTNTTIVNLSAGDYVIIYNGENTVSGGRTNNGFSGYLIG